jgi:cell wall-associated NlpC family hydrolase
VDEKEKLERQKVVEIALTWQKTPYRHMGRVKGAGADCLTLLAEIFSEAGLIPKIQIPFYPQDWMHHRDAERYLSGLMDYAKEIDTPPQAGDIVLYKMGRCFSHGALVIEWPMILHAQAGCMVTLENAEAATWLTHVGENTADMGKVREKKFFSYWKKD